MKRIILIVLAVVFYSSSYAQYYKDQNYYIGGSVGYLVPIGDFADQAKAGPSVRLSAQRMVNKKIGVGAEISYSFLGQDKFWDGSHLGNYNVDYNIGSALVKASYFLDSWDKDFRPYLSLAFGYYYYHNSVNFTSFSSSSNNEKTTIGQGKVGLVPNIGFLYHLSDSWSFDMNMRFTYIPNFPKSVTKTNENGESYPYFLGFDKISLPELSMGFYYRF